MNLRLGNAVTGVKSNKCGTTNSRNMRKAMSGVQYSFFSKGFKLSPSKGVRKA